MKASFRHIFAALAATAALAGCTKETTAEKVVIVPDSQVSAVGGSRVIAVSFTAQTKTYLDDDGLQPKFRNKDSILISNGAAIDTCRVSVNGNKATISTDLTGPLTAVYPYKAAKMDSINPNKIVGVLVSTEQSGKFADANICMARMTDGNEESLSFENKTAVFCITPGAGDNIQYVEVSAEGFGIANDVPAGSDYKNYDKIHVNTTTADSVYVSILVPDNLKVSDLSFSDGTNVKLISDENLATPVAVSSIYTVTSTNWERKWTSLGVGEFFDYLVLCAGENYGIAKCTILQSPDGTQRYRIVNPYADKAQRSASWDEDCAQATPSDYIEFWVTDEETMSITWNSFWLTGLWYQGVSGDDIKAYLPSVLFGQPNEGCLFVEEKVVHFRPYYYIDGLGGFGYYDCYLSMPGGPDLEEWLDTNIDL